MSEVQQQLTMLSRQLGQLASRFTDSERQRAEEAATAAAMQASQEAEESGERDRKYKTRVERSYGFLTRSIDIIGGEVEYYCCCKQTQYS